MTSSRRVFRAIVCAIAITLHRVTARHWVTSQRLCHEANEVTAVPLQRLARMGT
jgi:hypothetical protein